jgi:predicted DsbA family dithiol-disulfide isomerase
MSASKISRVAVCPGSLLAEEGLVFDLAWLPFQLNPDMPTEGVDRRAYRSEKFGSWERSQQMDAQVADAGRVAGVAFRHDLMARTPNTVEAHRLIRLAGADGVQHVSDASDDVGPSITVEVADRWR